jgi:hypothetical protein
VAPGLTRLLRLGLALVVLLSWGSPALASKTLPGTAISLSLTPDDPFFIDGEGVIVLFTVHAASTISGDLGVGVALPPELSAGACPAPGDLLLIFLGAGSQCLSSWITTPASRIAQLPGITLQAGQQLTAELAPLAITPSVPRAAFLFFAYILDSANRAVILDLTATTLDIE